MDIMVEKPGWRSNAVGLWISTVFVLLFSLVLLALSVRNGILYNYVEQTGAVVQATGYKVEEYYDEDLDFDLYIKFAYEEQTYSVFYKTYDTRTEAEAMLGKTVEWHINPEDPLEDLNNVGFNVRFYGLFGTFSLIFAMVMLLERKRKLYIEEYGFTTEYIQIDLKRQLLSNSCVWAGIMSGSIALLIVWLCFRTAMGDILVVAIAGMIISSIIFIPWIKDVKKVREGQYYRSHQTVYDAKIDYGGDSTTYDLYLTNGIHQWTKSVSKKKFEAARIGDTSQTVFLKGAKKPFLTTNIIE